MKVICTVGMPGSGKSIFLEVAKELNLKCYVMGDVVRREVEKRNLTPSVEVMNRVATSLRKEEGLDAIAKRLVNQFLIGGDGDDTVLIDGVRNIEEIEYFKSRLGSVIVIAVHSSPKTRFKRLRERGRPGDPKNWEEFVKRDLQELEWGIGKVIALADYMVVNEDLGIEEFKSTVKNLLLKVVRDDTSRV